MSAQNWHFQGLNWNHCCTQLCNCLELNPIKNVTKDWNHLSHSPRPRTSKTAFLSDRGHGLVQLQVYVSLKLKKLTAFKFSMDCHALPDSTWMSIRITSSHFLHEPPGILFPLLQLGQLSFQLRIQVAELFLKNCVSQCVTNVQFSLMQGSHDSAFVYITTLFYNNSTVTIIPVMLNKLCNCKIKMSQNVIAHHLFEYVPQKSVQTFRVSILLVKAFCIIAKKSNGSYN